MSIEDLQPLLNDTSSIESKESKERLVNLEELPESNFKLIRMEDEDDNIFIMEDGSFGRWKICHYETPKGPLRFHCVVKVDTPSIDSIKPKESLVHSEDLTESSFKLIKTEDMDDRLIIMKDGGFGKWKITQYETPKGPISRQCLVKMETFAFKMAPDGTMPEDFDAADAVDRILEILSKYLGVTIEWADDSDKNLCKQISENLLQMLSIMCCLNPKYKSNGTRSELEDAIREHYKEYQESIKDLTPKQKLARENATKKMLGPDCHFVKIE